MDSPASTSSRLVAWLAAIGAGHGLGALMVVAALWSFVRSPLVSGDARMAAHAAGYRPAMLHVEHVVYTPPHLEGQVGVDVIEGNAIGDYYVQGTIEGQPESLRLGEAPPADSRQAVKAGDDIRVLFNPEFSHPAHEAGTGLRVQRFDPDFAAGARARVRRGLIAAYAPVAVLLAGLAVAVVLARLTGPTVGRWSLAWMTPLLWLVPTALFLAFQVVVAILRAGVEGR